MTLPLITILFWVGFGGCFAIAQVTGDDHWTWAAFGYGTGVLVALLGCLYYLRDKK